jgi:outer membrane receptor protein involved in Fe transport
MHVGAEPGGTSATERLEALLAEHGLTTRPGPRRSLLIVPIDVAPAPVRGTEPAPAVVPEIAPEIDEIVVAASRYELARSVDDAPYRLQGTDLETLPDLGDDSLRAVQRLPGAAGDGFAGRAHIRGGEAGETLVRLDRLRLYEPYHLDDFQSIFSSMDPRVVSAMDVYTGGFPAAFGDRMSGVVDVTSLTPPAARYHELGMSFFNTSALSAGRFHDDGEWVASLRRSNLDLLYSRFSSFPERPRYLDAFGKVGYTISDALRASVNVFYSRDDVTLNDDVDVEESASSEHEDRYAWIRLDHTLGPALTGTTLIAHTTLSGLRTGTTAKPGISTGWLLDRRDFAIDSVQSEWSWRPRESVPWSVHFGGSLARSRGAYDYRDEVEFELLVAGADAPRELERTRGVAASPSGSSQSFYGSVAWEPSEKLALDVGARIDRQTLDPGRSGALDPRFSLRYELAERTSLRVSLGRFHQAQAINELQVSDGVDGFFAPQRSRHTVIGIEHALRGGVVLQLEAYEKDMSRLRPRYENLLNSLTLLPELKPDRVRVAPESARARGFELLVTDGRAARLDWWASYGYGRVSDVLSGSEVLRSWDQTHAISGGVGWEAARWTVSLAGSYRSGWPRTAVLGLEDVAGAPSAMTGPRNAERAARFRSLDLRVMRIFSVRAGELSAFLELTNAFDYVNECCVDYELEPDEAGIPTFSLTPVNYLPRIPSIGFLWSF